MKKRIIIAFVIAFFAVVVALTVYIGYGNKNEEPIKPAPPAMVMHADSIEALASAAVGLDGSLGVDAVNAILKPFGKTIDEISEITGGMVTKDDIEAGRITARRLKQLGDTCEVEKKTYALKLEIYENEIKLLENK